MNVVVGRFVPLRVYWAAPWEQRGQTYCEEVGHAAKIVAAGTESNHFTASLVCRRCNRIGYRDPNFGIIWETDNDFRKRTGKEPQQALRQEEGYYTPPSVVGGEPLRTS